MAAGSRDGQGMADVDFDDFDDGPDVTDGRAAGAARASRLINIAGAACSVALVVGLGLWGYKIAVRDVNGVPVVKAMQGPMRVAPQNPGGEVAAHQGLAVNDVAAVGTAAAPTERLILAPRPVELAAEDEAAEELNGTAPPLPDSGPLAAVVAPVAPLASTAPEPGADPDAVAKALAEALATDPDSAGIEELPAGEVVASAVIEAPAPLAPATDVAAMPVPEPLAAAPAVRPRARPASLMAPAAAPAETAPDAPAAAAADTAPTLGQSPAPIAVTEVAASAIPVGTRLVQLGAFDTEDQARAEWVKLTNQFGDSFAGKALVVQAAESGGRTFFRLRAHGFADEAEARSFCLTLLEQNAACIPVEQR